MNLQEYVAEYHSVVEGLGLKAEEVVLSAGGALFVLGLRDGADDLDLDIPRTAWEEQAARHGYSYFGTVPRVTLPWSRAADLHVNHGGDTVMVNGVCIRTPERLLKQKRFLASIQGRSAEKLATDHRDIANLEAYIAKSAR